MCRYFTPDDWLVLGGAAVALTALVLMMMPWPSRRDEATESS
jgi:hypothetical protein